jgi:ATP synthase protein I
VKRPEPRSILSVGLEWASRATTIGLEFALPPLLGVLIDRRWETGPWATVVGAVLGFAVGMMHVLRLARELSKS